MIPAIQVHLTRSELCKMIEEHGGSEGLNLSGYDLRGIDLSSDVLRADLAHLANVYDSPPAWYCTSTGGICLRGAIFREAHLEGALLWRGDFTGATFESALLWRGDFTGATFESAYLDQVDFGSSNLTQANFTNAHLRRATLARADVSGADFTGAFLSESDASNVNLHEAASLKRVHVAGTVFNNTNIPRHHLKEGLGEEQDGDFLQAKEAYLALKNSYLTRGCYNDASWAYIKERRMERKANSPIRAWRFYRARELPSGGFALFRKTLPFYVRHSARWLFDWLSEFSCGYGEKPLRPVICAALIILVFAYLYFMAGGLTATSYVHVSWRTYFEYSAATFTTTSVPGVAPATDGVELLSSLEAFLGIGSLSLVMFTLGNRIARS